MKIKSLITAQCLMLLAACLQLAAQRGILPVNHGPDETSPAVSIPRLAAQARVRTLRGRLEECVERLPLKSEMQPHHLGGRLNMMTSVSWYGARVTASFFPSGDQS